ncbi:MAG: hypothetical protein JXQ75_08185 [Phycisphaerae bacterium]|nr:hypothetical protein [Phycisphaerae bacterium]
MEIDDWGLTIGDWGLGDGDGRAGACVILCIAKRGESRRRTIEEYPILSLRRDGAYMPSTLHVCTL